MGCIYLQVSPAERPGFLNEDRALALRPDRVLPRRRLGARSLPPPHVSVADRHEWLVLLRGLRPYPGFRHAGVGYVRPPRFDGRTTNTLAGNIRWAKLAIFSFSHRPLGYISRLAAFCVLGTCLAILYYMAL